MAMTVKDICERVNARVLCGSADKDACGVYVGDLLSRAMSHVEAGNVWITIMANANVVAVATLTEPSVILLAEGVILADDALQGAQDNGITVLTSPLSAYELCLKLGEMAESEI